MPRFAGVYVAVITPFTNDDRVDYDRLAEHVEWLISQGVHGIVPSGSCAEYGALTDEERARTVELIGERCKGRTKMVVGTGASSTEKAVYWAKHAAGAGAHGIMALPPGGYRPSRRELAAWYRALSAAGLPIIAYNNPFDTTVDLTPDMLIELSKVEMLVAVKEYSGDVRRIPQILETTGLEVLVGCDDIALEGLLVGASGWIAGLTNVLARESLQLYELAMAGNVKEAMPLYRKLLPLFRYDARPVFVQAIKYAFELIGKPVGATRGPRLPLEAADKAEIARVLEQFVPLSMRA
ncbi:MAG: dihydrodipicolinate synthase family protein [Vulcanimicrobiaceae bacterium]